MPLHYAFNKYIKRLNEVYDNYEALYKNEYDSSYFKWLEVNAPEKSVYIYERGRSDHRIIVALNFSDNEYAPFTFKVEEELRLREIVNSDSDIYGGSTWGIRSDVTTTKEDNYLYNLSINLKPFSGIIYEVVNDQKGMSMVAKTPYSEVLEGQWLTPMPVKILKRLED